MLRSSQSARSSPASTPWWQRPDALTSEITGADRPHHPARRYRIADGELALTSNCGRFLASMHDVWGDCAISDPSFHPSARLVCSLISLQDSSAFLLIVHEPAQLSVATIASDVLKHLYQGDEEKYVEVTSPQAGRRAFATASDLQRPVILAEGGRMLIDLQMETLRFIPYFLVGTVLRLQRDVIAMHAGSVMIQGNGVLIAGPSRSGKTTQSLALAARGHRFLGDNIAALRPTSGELLPICRTGFIRAGPRAQRIDALLRASGMALAESDARTQVPFRVTQFLPQSRGGPAPLRHAFFLSGVISHPAIRAFSPELANFEAVLRPLTFDCAVATSWGSTAGEWWMKHMRLQRALSRAHCYYLDAGEPDATADLIERTVLEDPWDSR